MWGAGDRCDLQPEPSIKNYKVWLEWWAHQVNMPDQWGELVAIPNVGDPKRLACKICTSWEVPQVRSKALRDSNSYTAPPAPKCLQRKMFCWSLTPIYPVRITVSSNHWGPWLMPRPFSTGLRRPTHWAPMNCAVWQCVCMTCSGLWYHSWPLVIETSLNAWPMKHQNQEEAAQPNPAILTPTPDPRPGILPTDGPAILTTAPAGLADELAVTTTPLETANNVESAKDW